MEPVASGLTRLFETTFVSETRILWVINPQLPEQYESGGNKVMKASFYGKSGYSNILLDLKLQN